MRLRLTCIFGRHDWHGCKCLSCGRTRADGHDWSDSCNSCRVCGFAPKPRIDIERNNDGWLEVRLPDMGTLKEFHTGKSPVGDDACESAVTEILPRLCSVKGSPLKLRVTVHYVYTTSEQIADLDGPPRDAYFQQKRGVSTYRFSPLNLAVRGLIDVVHFLVANGIDVNERGRLGRTPLHDAAGTGHVEIAEWLLANGANVNAREEDGDLPLHNAVGSTEMVKLLLANGANVNATGRSGNTPLHYAVRGSVARKDVAELLIANGANVNAETLAMTDFFGRVQPGRTPSWFVSENNPEMLELLRRHGG